MKSIYYLLFVILLNSCTPPITNFPDESINHQKKVYRIQPYDELEISFVGEESYDQFVKVDASGYIDMGYLRTDSSVSRIKASMKTPSQLMIEINHLAEKNGLLNSPRSQVSVAEANERFFVVLGQVGQPGRVAFPNGMSPEITIQEALALANGYTRLANPKTIKLTRNGRVYNVNLVSILSGKEKRVFHIIPGDLIFVPERLF